MYSSINDLQDFFHIRLYNHIKSLIKNNKHLNVNNITFPFNRTPLQLAIRLRDRQLVNLLIDMGANVNALDYENNTLINYMILNCNDKDEKIVRIFKSLLNNGGDVNEKDSNNHTPLQNAIVCRKEKFSILLLQYNANDSIETDSCQTIIQLAMIQKYSISFIASLLLHYIQCDAVQTNVDVDDENVTTSIETAISLSNHGYVKLLLLYNAEFNYKKIIVKLFLIRTFTNSEDIDTITYYIYQLVKRYPSKLVEIFVEVNHSNMINHMRELNCMTHYKIWNTIYSYFDILIMDTINFAFLLKNDINVRESLYKNKTKMLQLFPLFSKIFNDNFTNAIRVLVCSNHGINILQRNLPFILDLPDKILHNIVCLLRN